MNEQFKDFIQRPDGSWISFDQLTPERQIEHEAVMDLCDMARRLSDEMARFKRHAINEMVARREMLLKDYGVQKGGKDGNMTLRSECGRFAVKLSVNKQISFGPELEAAKALLQEFLRDELDEGGSEVIRDIIMDVFKLNGNGRIDTDGILGLRKHTYDDPRWVRAMQAIDDAIIRDASATYIYFFEVDPQAKPKSAGEERIKLNLAEL